MKTSLERILLTIQEFVKAERGNIVTLTSKKIIRKCPNVSRHEVISVFLALQKKGLIELERHGTKGCYRAIIHYKSPLWSICKKGMITSLLDSLF